MNILMEIGDAEDAIDYFQECHPAPLPVKAYVAGHLSKLGYSNARIRESLDVKTTYECTDLRRIGRNLSPDQLELWWNNEDRIKLGHVRAISRLPAPEREKVLRDLLVKRISVAQIEAMAVGKASAPDVDTAKFEREMSEAIGRGVRVQTKGAKQSGRIILDFYSLEDLERVAEDLGYHVSRDW